MTPITTERRFLIWHGWSSDRFAVSKLGFTEKHAHNRAFRAWERAVGKEMR